MTTLQDVETWRGQKAVDVNGEKIGTIEDIYLDRHSGEPEWATIKTGLLGMKVTFAPIREAGATGEGEVRLPFAKDQVKEAPSIEPDGDLTEAEERRLYRHYGRADYELWTGEDRTRDLGLPPEDERAGRFTRGATDDAMTRSEEELEVGKRRREVGRARLRKYVVVEHVQRTVPVEREEVRVEREPITDANRDAAMRGPEITESEHEVTLHAEEPVVDKRTVPKERVRMEKDRIEEQRTVGDEVRKERIEREDA